MWLRRVHSLEEIENRMRRYVIWAPWLVLAATIVVGCGGGGGGGTPPPTDQFVLTGTVLDDKTSSPVVGAVVEVATNTTSTDSQGRFRFELSVAPTVETYSIDGTAASPAPGYYVFWAKADGKEQNAACIELPTVMPKTGTDLGTVYLRNTDNPPPFPPLCP